MKKLFTLLVAIAAAILPSFAGGYLTNTNQHVAFLRNPARDATTEIDAVYSNPAGISFLSRGWHFSFNGQSAFQTRKITSTFAPFADNADGSATSNGTKTYKGEASAPFIPSLYAAYKFTNWTFAGSFALTGGGGKATFNEGLPSFESQVSLIPSLLTSYANSLNIPGLAASQYSYNTYMQGRQYIFGLQMGAAYRWNEHLSTFAGIRVNYVSNHYYGYLRNISANLGNSTAMTNLSTYFTDLSTQMAAAAVQYQTAGDATTAAYYTTLAEKTEGLANTTADKELDCDQTGWGITPIIGIDYKTGPFNFAAKYEFLTKLNIQNQTKVNTTGVKDYNDGINTPSDIPALLTVGASYAVLPQMRLSAGYHHYYDKQARMANDRQKYLTKGTNEYLGGIEYDITSKITASAGYQKTDYGVTDAFQNDMSFYISSYSIGMGAAFKVTKKVKVNVAYFMTNYDSYTKKSSDYNSTGVAGTDVYTRTNKVFGVGLDYNF